MAIKYTRRIPRQQESAPMSEYDKERERIRNRFTAPINDDNNVWVQSAKRGQAAIDNGQQLRPTPTVGSREFATRTLPSGTPNAPINYETIGDTINQTGIQKMREAGGYSEDELANPGKIPMNWGMYQYLDSVGGLDHKQAMYEAYLREKRRQQMAYEAAMRQNYGPAAAQDAMALGVPDDSGSTGASEGFDMPGNSVADYYAMDNAYAQPSVADYYQLDAQTYKDANPFAYHDANDPLIRGYNALRAYNQNMR